MKARGRRVSALAILGAIALYGLAFIASPFLLVFACMAGLAFVLSATASTRRARRAWLAILGSVVGLELMEGYAVLTRPGTIFWSGPFLSFDPELGYGLLLDDDESRRERGGLRATPASSRSSPCKVAFFGGSFANGTGLEDSETLPQSFARAATDPVAVYNFGLGGYGAHQMLRMLETGRVKYVLGERLDHAIYVAIPQHAERSSGRMPWDLSGPSYSLLPDGRVHYVGPFRGRAAAWILYQAQRSYAGALVLRSTLPSGGLKPGEVEVYLGILREARRLTEESFQGRFRILLWGRDDALWAKLEGEGFQVHRISEIIPDLDENRSRYFLPDGHPSADANLLVGRHLARTLAAESVAGAICEPATSRHREPRTQATSSATSGALSS